jgi:hypothetical protein
MNRRQELNASSPLPRLPGCPLRGEAEVLGSLSKAGSPPNGVLLDSVPSRADWAAEGDQEGANLGISVGTAGDVNGDGFDDVIVGAYGYDDDQKAEGTSVRLVRRAARIASDPSGVSRWLRDHHSA